MSLKLNGASIRVVPSVHFRLAFAEEVNRLCADEKPDAVAVELGPQTAGAASAWLREQGAGRPSFRLPCMLGLIKRNHRIRPSLRAAAVRLQELAGTALHDLSPEVLHEHLGYSAVSIVPLSSTDSIVEAMRCALELNVPLYGIDLENTAERRPPPIMLQDPSLAVKGLEEYVDRNAAVAERQRDVEVDERRELAMAARLAALSKRHRRIVFVCGLAHWRQMLTHLRNPELKPAPYPSVSDADASEFQRAILHPLLAIYHLDTYPAFLERYEESRKGASARRSALVRGRRVDRDDIFLEILEETYRRRFASNRSGEQLDRALEDLEAKGDFEQLLRNFCTVRQYRTPDLYSVFTVAGGVMSETFRKILADVAMDIEWVSQSDYPDLPTLAPAPASSNHAMRAELLDLVGDPPESVRRGKPFFVESVPGRSCRPMDIPITWNPPDAPPPAVPAAEAGTETWIPTEDLINALLFQAVRIAREQGAGAKLEPFEGSLLDGVDMKSTLRSAARGENQVFVRDVPRRRVTAGEEDLDGFPVVWIFRLMEGAKWDWKYSGDGLGKLASGPLSAKWQAAGLPDDGLMITSVAAVTVPHSQRDEILSTSTYTVTTDRFIGKLSYWPQCCERRTAEWAIETGLTRNPVCRSAPFEGLREFYRERYGLDLRGVPWHVAMIRMAIPLATKAVTLVAPDGYVVPAVVHQEAAQRRVRIRVVPLSYFPSETLRRISHVVWLPVIRREVDELGIDVPVYPEHVARHFNEPSNAYRKLLPSKWH